MTAADLAAAATLDDEHLETLAETIEAALERSGDRGISPARAARRAGCTTADACCVIAHLIGRQRAHTGRSWRHIHAGA